ncbi:MAG TPA: hypothetical protein VFJ64_08860 [Solirubrobacterales bacterium]|nr:hypothetical protein [Solirubrobacterales bacterium]
MAVGQQVECLAKRVLDVAEGGLGRFDVPFGLLGFGGEPLLLFAQQVDGDRSGVVGAQQLLALLAQLGEALALTGCLGFGLLAHPGHRLAQFLPHQLGLAARQLHLAVGALYRRLDQVDRDVGLLAARSPHSPGAIKVRIASAIAFRMDQPHPRATAPAVERALQVVAVLSVLLRRVAMGGQHGLCLGEGGGIDQVLMAPLVLDPGVADDAHVVGVLKQGRQLGARERLFGLGRCRAGA